VSQNILHWLNGLGQRRSYPFARMHLHFVGYAADVM
jgi:hypothetical protein